MPALSSLFQVQPLSVLAIRVVVVGVAAAAAAVEIA